MFFGDANRLLCRHEPSGPHGQVIRAITARSLVRESEEWRHQSEAVLFGNLTLPYAMHRSAQWRGAARASDRLVVIITAATVLMLHIGASARKWSSGLTGMPWLKLCT